MMNKILYSNFTYVGYINFYASWGDDYIVDYEIEAFGIASAKRKDKLNKEESKKFIDILQNIDWNIENDMLEMCGGIDVSNVVEEPLICDAPNTNVLFIDGVVPRTADLNSIENDEIRQLIYNVIKICVPYL